MILLSLLSSKVPKRLAACRVALIGLKNRRARARELSGGENSQSIDGRLTRHFRGTPQMYLLFVMARRFENSRRAQRLHGGAPEFGRSAAS